MTEGVTFHSVKGNTIAITHDEDKISVQNLINLIKHKGYRASNEPFIRRTLKERWHDFKENKGKYAIEYTMLKYSLITLILLFAIESVAQFAIIKDAIFLQRYGWWVGYSNLIIVSIGAAMWHLNAYRANITSMTGMMVGMTFGMQTGMIVGTIIASTNGLFVGGMTGMIAATLVGIYNGKCCGVMGVLEGMMAGIMGGLMGAMVGTMFFADRILLLMPVFMLLNLIVMWGLSYMLYEEVVEDKEIQRNPHSFISFAGCCIIAIALLIAIMIFAPKSGLARVF